MSRFGSSIAELLRLAACSGLILSALPACSSSSPASDGGSVAPDDSAPAAASDAGADLVDAGPAPTVPGGKRFFTVVFGRFTPTCASNWVRLEFITFAADGTVAGAFWQWTQSQPVSMVSASTTSPLCTGAACNVYSPAGFLTSGGTSQDGTFSQQGDMVTIVWRGGYTDRWKVTAAADDVARLTWISSSSAATHGIGYGSNHSTNRFLALDELHVAANWKSYQGRYQAAVGTTLLAGPSAIAFDGRWMPCQGASPTCLRATFPHSPSVCTSGCGAYGNPEKTITYYLASRNDSRKVAYENYCTCLAQGHECYNGGSHIKPMLQVIGDTGVFHGWVGAEASLRTSCSGTLSVYGYTDLGGDSALQAAP